MFFCHKENLLIGLLIITISRAEFTKKDSQKRENGEKKQNKGGFARDFT